MEPLGRGGMGVVWRARDELLDRDVAVKEIHRPGSLAPEDSLPQRALREARAAARLRHRGIIMVHDVAIHDGRPWIVMELIKGHSLAEVLEHDSVLPERRAVEIGLRVLDALDAAHRNGILHRDVKPANILLDGDRVVLTDFGIAAMDGATTLTATGHLIGSPEYIAPERINGQKAGPAADLWALGITLYTMVAGHSPFRRSDVQATYAAVLTADPDPPPGSDLLWPAIAGLLHKDPTQRLTAERAVPLLAAVTNAPPTPTRPGSAIPDNARTVPLTRTPSNDTDILAPGKRHRRWIAVLALPLVLLLAISTAVWLAWPRGDTPASPAAHPSSTATSTHPAPSTSTDNPLPPPPAGFRIAINPGVGSLAVPQTWVDVGTQGWSNHPNLDPSPFVAVYLYIVPEEGKTPVTALAETEQQIQADRPDDQYERIRLTELPTQDVSTAAELEYTAHRGTYDHELLRHITTPNGRAYLLIFQVRSDTAANMAPDWSNAQPTFTTILNSFRPGP